MGRETLWLDDKPDSDGQVWNLPLEMEWGWLDPCPCFLTMPKLHEAAEGTTHHMHFSGQPRFWKAASGRIKRYYSNPVRKKCREENNWHTNVSCAARWIGHGAWSCSCKRSWKRKLNLTYEAEAEAGPPSRLSAPFGAPWFCLSHFRKSQLAARHKTMGRNRLSWTHWRMWAGSITLLPSWNLGAWQWSLTTGQLTPNNPFIRTYREESELERRRISGCCSSKYLVSYNT